MRGAGGRRKWHPKDTVVKLLKKWLDATSDKDKDELLLEIGTHFLSIHERLYEIECEMWETKKEYKNQTEALRKFTVRYLPK